MEACVKLALRCALAALLYLFFPVYPALADCEGGHWIDAVLGDGQLVKLEDGTLWQVSPGEEITSALWLPTTEIVACDDKLINVEDNEIVEAMQIR